MYKSCNIIASKAKTGKIFIFNYMKEQKEEFLQLVLEGLQTEGFALDWKMDSEELISGSLDGSICHWDLNKQPSCNHESTPVIQPI